MITSFIAGDTFSVTEDFVDYSATSWTMTLRMVPISSDGAEISVVGTASGTQHLLAATAATTATWQAGTYRWFQSVVSGSARHTLADGVIVLKADPASMEPGTDDRSIARKSLESINAVLAKRATLDQMRYVINGRELQRMTVADLILLKSHFTMQVNSETQVDRAAVGLPDRRRLYIRTYRA